jgi:hypothetical protein
LSYVVPLTFAACAGVIIVNVLTKKDQ